MATDIPNWLALPLGVLLSTIVSVLIVVKQKNIIDFYGTKNSTFKERTKAKDIQMFSEAKHYCDNKIEFIIYQNFIINNRFIDILFIIGASTSMIVLFSIRSMISDADVDMYFVKMKLSKIIMLAYLSSFFVQFIWCFNRFMRAKRFMWRVGQFHLFQAELKKKWGTSEFD
ncbi:hypothetical protein [Bosea sp. 685]|uniref:hypothetical protein n=1 Tax=Bosea sp. 685 TaxID=3080057 RepID=UPI002892B905|nr:hypothetical protein [Bosea sp. 685]WNJ91057.1 hypothetical protein RMR04_01745 [Bosea sp. 685]